MTIEVDEETCALIKELKSLQPHKEDAMKEVLKEAVEKAKQQKFKALKNPNNLQMAVPPSARRVQREVYAKANHKCQNCGSKHALEIDHRQPRALGGSHDPLNLRVLCRNCNQRAGMKAGLSMASKTTRGPNAT